MHQVERMLVVAVDGHHAITPSALIGHVLEFRAFKASINFEFYCSNFTV